MVISVLLLVLTLRALRLPGTPLANICLAVCAILWNAGVLVSSFQPFGIAIAAFFRRHNERAKPFRWRREVKGSQLRNAIVNLCN